MIDEPVGTKLEDEEPADEGCYVKADIVVVNHPD